MLEIAMTNWLVVTSLSNHPSSPEGGGVLQFTWPLNIELPDCPALRLYRLLPMANRWLYWGRESYTSAEAQLAYSTPPADRVTNRFYLLRLFFFATLDIIGLMSRVFTNGPGDWGSIPGRVIPKTRKNGTWCLLA